MTTKYSIEIVIMYSLFKYKFKNYDTQNRFFTFLFDQLLIKNVFENWVGT